MHPVGFSVSKTVVEVGKSFLKVLNKELIRVGWRGGRGIGYRRIAAGESL